MPGVVQFRGILVGICWDEISLLPKGVLPVGSQCHLRVQVYYSPAGQWCLGSGSSQHCCEPVKRQHNSDTGYYH